MIVNLTPHEIKVLVSGNPDEGDAEFEIFPKSETPARCPASSVYVGTIGRIPIYQENLGAVENLPAPGQGTRYIVSRPVKAECGDRADLLVPFGHIRDADGNVVGCKGLSR
jgi:hypothetical protein